MNSAFTIWLNALRPKTLLLAIAVITTGSTLAYADNQFSFAVSLLALLTATLLQILSNLANDYGDSVQGTDNDDRLGPIRGMQQGVITQSGMKKAMALNILLIVCSGLSLIVYALQSPSSIFAFMGLGVLSILSAIAYTMGNKPYGYIGLGDFSVFIFFGILAILGTYFLHTGQLNSHLLLPAIGAGFLSAGVLNINNMRDVENDAVCNKRTLVVRIGLPKAKVYHLALLVLSIMSFCSYLWMNIDNKALLILMLIPAAFLYRHGKIVWTSRAPKELIPMLPHMVKGAFICNLIFSLILLIDTLY